MFITKNGKDDLVVMSQAVYDRQQARLELYGLLEEAATEAQRGSKAIPHQAMMQILRKRLG